MEPGTLIAERYRLIRKLGEGGMGAVYEAAHVVTGRRVAIKILEKRSDLAPETVERFELEARASGDIAHDNIVEVFDAGHEPDGSLYIVMELLEGETFDAAIKRDKVMQPELLGPVMDQLLTGLAAMHARGYVHRDLKPANIFVARVDGALRVKLLDFGIAKALGEDGRTRTGMVMGTPAFMAPEQMRNAKAATPKCDLWSVGVMLYEALVGHRPFRGETFGLLAMITGPETHVPLRKINPRLPRGLSDLVDELLSKNPEMRPGDAAKLRERLHPLIEQCPPLEPFEEPAEPPSSSSTSLERPSHKRAPPEPPRRRASPWRVPIALGAGALAGLVGVAVYASQRLRASTPVRRAIVEDAPVERPVASLPALDRFVRRWTQATASPPPPAAWSELYAGQVSFHRAAALSSPPQLRRYWADHVEAGGRFDPNVEGARFVERRASLDLGVAAACINLSGATGRVIEVRAPATLRYGDRVESPPCREARGEYILRLRRVGEDYRICQEQWSPSGGFCDTCAQSDECVGVRRP